MRMIKSLIKKYFGSFVFFYSYLRNKIFVAFSLSIAISFLDGLGLSMFFPLLQIVEGGNINNTSNDIGNFRYLIDFLNRIGISLNLISVLIIMIVFFAFKGVATYVNNIYRIILQQSFIRKIRLDLLHSLNQMSFKKFIMSDSGRIQNTMSGEVDRISTSFMGYFGSFQNGLMLFVYVVFAFLLDSKFALLVSVGGALTHFIYTFIYKHTKGASKKLTRYNNVFQGQLLQHVAQFKYLKSTGRINEYGDRLKDTILKIEESRRRIGFLSSISMAAREPLLVIIIAAVIYIQVSFLGGNIGTMLISLLFFYRALVSLTAFQQTWNSFLQVSGSLDNVQDFQKFLKQNKEWGGKLMLDKFSDSITLKNVSFQYDDTVILKNINLDIKKNGSYAFVGESGSGKSTLVNLLSGLMHENEGEIRVDGIPLKQIKKETYQNRIGYVTQEAVIFNDSIYNNVTFWAEKTPENISRFKQSIVQSSLDDFIGDLPDKEDSLLGNNGLNLSGGQKQRISIARELYRDIEILILDEATSALDSETEREIKQSIEALQGHYTLLIVAHRLSTIRNADKVILMDRGKIVDIDSFDRLTQKQDQFRRMVELQEL